MALWLFLGSFNGLIAVAAGAYGWHALASEPALQKMFEIASFNQMVHGLAMLAVAWLATREAGMARLLAHAAGACFALGLVLFSGTLYWLVLADTLLVRGAAPLGGFLLMAGWLLLMAVAAFTMIAARRSPALRDITKSVRASWTIVALLSFALAASACTNTSFSLSSGSPQRAGSSWEWLDQQNRQDP